MNAYLVTDLPPRMAARIAICPESGCWIGTGKLDRDGYAKYSGMGLHRAVWLRLVGEIDAGLQLDHREDWGCTSRACCWPEHLKAVTPRENTLRGNSPSAVNFRKTECDHGHPFDLFTTYHYKGRRYCRPCNVIAVAAYKKRRQGQIPQTNLAAAA